MRLPRKRVDRIALAAVAVGLVILLVAGFTIWHGNSSDSSAKSPQDIFVPYETNTQDLQGTRPTQGSTGTPSTTKSSDPFTSDANDHKMHHVVVSVVSDGEIFVGYRYRGGRKATKVTTRSYSNTATVHGPQPLAQVGAQLKGSATYATCTITLDGKQVAKSTTKGAGSVVVCTA
ncbi:MAG: hypothetical protein JWQ70_1626 [Aeromicrobium sp.]|nr:hypothetical protein [Aeromicrobium sp.]